MFADVKSKFNHFNLKSLVLHQNSKILPDITGKLKVVWFPIFVTAPNIERLLKVPKLKSDAGFKISSAIYDTCQEWSL